MRILLALILLAVPALSQSGTIKLGGTTNADVLIGIPPGDPGKTQCWVYTTHQFKHVKGVEAFSSPAGNFWDWDTDFQDSWEIHTTAVPTVWTGATTSWQHYDSGTTAIFDGAIDFTGTSGHTLSMPLNTSAGTFIPVADAPNARLKSTVAFSDTKTIPAGSFYLSAQSQYAATVYYQYY